MVAEIPATNFCSGIFLTVKEKEVANHFTVKLRYPVLRQGYFLAGFGVL